MWSFNVVKFLASHKYNSKNKMRTLGQKKMGKIKNFVALRQDKETLAERLIGY